MKIIVKNEPPKFTKGTTYERFQEKARIINETIVKPQSELMRKRLEEKSKRSK